ncbi:hypothetical protein [Clostridium culturomicium]|uniref:hypothetical protein n=1 Tax=Clostridium culturomicium TaxID=1499683 RepID=UPI00058BEBEB|nr:hypothetical protein [Clostridium culturomicium]
MKDAVEINICGIKCDNPKCDFNDMSVKLEDYKEWLNKPCPKCGENLFTEEDFANTMMMISFIDSMNKILPKRTGNEEIVTATVDMNGTGKIKININE